MFDFRICRGTVKRLQKIEPVKIEKKKLNSADLDVVKDKK